MLKLRIIILYITTSLIPLLAHATLDEISGIKGTLFNINNAMNHAVSKSENLYEQFSGIELIDNVNLLGDELYNAYLSQLYINKRFIITAQFADSAPTSSYSQGNVPISKSLMNKKIILVPIYKYADEVITSWECLTNADKDISKFTGSSSTPEFSSSLITQYTKQEQLSLCIYVEDIDLVINETSSTSEDSNSNNNYISDNIWKEASFYADNIHGIVFIRALNRKPIRDWLNENTYNGDSNIMDVEEIIATYIIDNNISTDDITFKVPSNWPAELQDKINFYIEEDMKS